MHQDYQILEKKNYKRNLINIIDTYKELVKYHGNRSLSKLRLLLFDNRGKSSKNLYDSYINNDKTGYNEILKYNIHNNCHEKNTTFTLPLSRKSSPSRKSPLSTTSPPSKLSVSNKSSPSRKSLPSLLSESFSINEKLIPKVTKFTNPRPSLHNMTTRSKVKKDSL